MQTLHDFYVVTKGHEYLIAVAFLLLFPLFWRLIAGKDRNHRRD
jgi:hypothetical protein